MSVKVPKFELLILCLLALQLVVVWVIQSSPAVLSAASATNSASLLRAEFNTFRPSGVVDIGLINHSDAGAVETGEQLQPKYPTPILAMTFHADQRPNLWGGSDVLPQWMKDYFAWHRHKTSLITQENWNNSHYIVMRCLGSDKRCGGTADRLKTVPLVLYWAARTQRILLIHWSRPALLEEFLLPPEGGIDWRLPDWMIEDVVHGGTLGNVAKLDRFLDFEHEIIVRTKLQSYNGGSLVYNQNMEGPRFETLYHDVWRVMFTPSMPIQKVVQQHLDMFNLRPGEYVAVHARALYATDGRHDSELHKMAENALNCASNLRPEGPIFFASDSKGVIDHVVGKIAKERTTKIVALQRDYDPLHLEKSLNWQNRTPSEYYDTFVDLYLLALSRCMTFNVGGFGEWSHWMSRNSSCFVQHGKKNRLLRCKWTGLPTPQYSNLAPDKPTFIPPMDAHRG